MSQKHSVLAYEVSASRVAPYSSRGPTDTGQQGIDVTGYTNIDLENGLYGVTPFRFSGTSASAPYVGGVAALVEQADGGNPSPATLATTLRSASDDIRVPGDDTVSGSGVINAVDAVESVSSESITPTPTSTPTPTPSSDITATRSAATTEVTPGTEITITTQITNVSGSVSVNTNYSPPVQSANITDITVNGTTVEPGRSSANPTGGVITINDVETDAPISVTERLTVSETAETTHIIAGNVTSGDTTVSFDPINISVTVPDNPVERYDRDNDGNISIDELGQAGIDFTSGKLTISELGEVAIAFTS